VALLAAWALSRGFTVDPVPVPGPQARPPAELPARLVLAPADFAALSGWDADRHDAALEAFVASCGALGAAGSGGTLGEALRGASPARARLCAAARAVPERDPTAARRFFEAAFVPFAAADRADREGLLTGYFEPELAASRRRRGAFRHPVYFPPGDRIPVELGDFKSDLAGRRIVGRIDRGRFLPYFDRREIERGALAGRRLELAWVEDPVALFFLQIQGSGRLRFSDGTLLRIGYAGQNGHDYTAIGKVLVERGELALEAVSLQSIRAWLRAHPAEADGVMAANRSYVFFRELPGKSPVGAAGVELTPRRSLAVDPAFWPYGLPLWAEATLPAAPEADRRASRLAALLVAQDTGGAIRGPVRGDLFWGPGVEAEAVAGRMREPLRLWLLWPRDLPLPAGLS
jgi:membrane-bound lytic murein transglycosylase A